MKKQLKFVIAALVLMVTTMTVSAQTFKKSDKFVEGTVSYTKSTDVKASYSIKPTIGYFLTSKVAVGVFGEVGETATEQTANIGAFARCYFLTIGKHCDIYSQVDVASNSTKVSDVKSTSFASNLGLGANYFVTSKLGLTMNVANLISFESADSKSTTTIGFEGVSNPFATSKFGVIYKF
jgi:outer membrane protein